MTLILGLRLAVAGGREALLRLAFTAAGVGVALTMLLLALAAPSAVDGRGERTRWHDAAYAWNPDSPDDSGTWRSPPIESRDGALFLAVSDYYDGTPMLRAYVAALGADPPVPPGLDRLPGPGEVAASPAMRELLESTPDDQLDDRFPGRVTMTIGEAGLEHDNELVALIGRTPDQLRDVGSVQEIRGFSPASFLGLHSILTGLVLLGVAPMVIPVVILVVVVTRVAAAQRERRLAAIRLVGATRLQTAVIASAETGLATVAGAALAWAGYELGRRILAATVTFQGGRFWLDDVAVAPRLLALVLAGAPILVMLTTIAALRRVQTRPLAISRRAVRRAPSAWGAVAVVAGLGGVLALALLQDRLGARVEQASGQLSALFALIAVTGFMLVGPWLCMVAGRGIARVSRGVPGLIAARRIAADPRATFRAVSAVALGVTAVTYLGSASAPLAQLVPPDPTAVVQGLRPGVVQVYVNGVPEQQVAPLLSDQAVTHRFDQRVDGSVVPCAGLARMRYNVTCPHPEELNLAEPGPGAEDLSILDIYIPTDGMLAAENRIRTQAANLVPNAIINTDRDPVDYNLETLFTDFSRLVSVAALLVLLMGAVGFTAGIIGSMLERRRPFTLLRATGMRIGELRWVVLLETSVTMVVTSAAGVALGMALAYAESTRDGGSWTWPGLEVFGYVGAGVLAALAFSTFALPLLGAMTRHDTVRYE